jgi:hypothetical protein
LAHPEHPSSLTAIRHSWCFLLRLIRLFCVNLRPIQKA